MPRSSGPHGEWSTTRSAPWDAEVLGESEQASLLNETLGRRKQTDEKLTKLAGQINSQANEVAEHVEEVSDKRKLRR